MKNEIVLFEAKDGSFAMPVQVKAETVWLSLLQMAQLFEKDKTVIFRHVKNAIADGEIDPKVTIANFAMVTPHGAIPGKTRVQNVDCYNLDVIISVGYRVHSPRGVEFRRWATKVLKEYIVRGYALNRERLKQLGQAVYNLIINAINYSGVDTVTVNLYGVGLSNVRFEVSDKGVGISADQLPYIWDRYYKVNRSENYKRAVKGTGLGLSIVKSVFECHVFRYGVESEEGSGRTCWFECPRERTDNERDNV